jgi:hypothetical protein
MEAGDLVYFLRVPVGLGLKTRIDFALAEVIYYGVASTTKIGIRRIYSEGMILKEGKRVINVNRAFLYKINDSRSSREMIQDILFFSEGK